MISSKPLIVVIGMTYQREAARREEITNASSPDSQTPPQDNQVPALEPDVIGHEVSVVPPLMTNGEIREDFHNLAQAMTSQDNAFTSQYKAITVHANKELGPRIPPHAKSMASHLRDFTRINPPMFFG